MLNSGVREYFAEELDLGLKDQQVPPEQLDGDGLPSRGSTSEQRHQDVRA